MLFVAGIPLFFLETAIGQFSGLSPSHAIANMVPVFQGLGFASIIINAIIGFYYNVIIAYCLYYFLFSININKYELSKVKKKRSRSSFAAMLQKLFSIHHCNIYNIFIYGFCCIVRHCID